MSGWIAAGAGPAFPSIAGTLNYQEKPMNIDTRTQELMAEHKETLARALATIEDAAAAPFPEIILGIEPHVAEQHEEANQQQIGALTGDGDLPPDNDSHPADQGAEQQAIQSQKPPADNDHVAERAEQFEQQPIAETPAEPVADGTAAAQEPGEQLS